MKLTGIDQLWVADITYIRLRAEFVYLAVILDGFSRDIAGDRGFVFFDLHGDTPRRFSCAGLRSKNAEDDVI